MLHDGQQFEVCVAEFFYVRNELIGEFPIGEPAVGVFRNAPPGTEMNFVNGDRRVEPILLFTRGEPVVVAPRIILQFRDNGAGFGAKLRTERVRIRFEWEQSSVGSGDLVLVNRAFAEAGEKEFPNS